jgi:hypothetical protein
LSLIPLPGTSSARPTQSWAVTRRLSQHGGRACAASLMTDSAWAVLALSYAASGNRTAALEAVKELRRYDPKKADELFNFIMHH